MFRIQETYATSVLGDLVASFSASAVADPQVIAKHAIAMIRSLGQRIVARFSIHSLNLTAMVRRMQY